MEISGRGAVVSLLATTIVGLAAVAGTVYVGWKNTNGYLEGNAATIEAQTKQLQIQNNQADRAYLRIQRQAVYARVMEANRTLVDAEQDVLLPARNRVRLTRADLRSVRVARRGFFASVDAAYVVGPSGVLPGILSVYRAHGDVQRTVDPLGLDATRTDEERRKYFALIRVESRRASQMATQFRMAIDANGRCQMLLAPMACQLDWLALAPLS